MGFSIEGPTLATAEICSHILRSLPEWFGIEEAIVKYSIEIDRLPTFLAQDANQVIGFLSIKQHNPFSAEIHVMGILKDAQRKGIGKALVDKVQEWLRTQGVEYLQVKTLGPSNSDQNYAGTRNFYLAMGFRPLEELKQIWDEQNPCLILVKKL
jgi:GNAT superfamily N-acetyltransferase